MISRIDDLWTITAAARCVPTNGIISRAGCLVMGAGVAKIANDRYPGLDRRLGLLVRQHGNRPYYLADLGIISFPTKYHWRDHSDLRLIAASARSLVVLTDQHHLQTVALPRVGTGLGGLAWTDVETTLAAILDDRFIVVAH